MRITFFQFVEFMNLLSHSLHISILGNCITHTTGFLSIPIKVDQFGILSISGTITSTNSSVDLLLSPTNRGWYHRLSRGYSHLSLFGHDDTTGQLERVNLGESIHRSDSIYVSNASLSLGVVGVGPISDLVSRYTWTIIQRRVVSNRLSLSLILGGVGEEGESLFESICESNSILRIPLGIARDSFVASVNGYLIEFDFAYFHQIGILTLPANEFDRIMFAVNNASSCFDDENIPSISITFPNIGRIILLPEDYITVESGECVVRLNRAVENDFYYFNPFQLNNTNIRFTTHYLEFCDPLL